MMELFLDIDGVILDFESSFVDFVRECYIPDLPTDFSLRSWELADEFKALDIQKVWYRFVNSEHFRRLKLLIDPASFNNLSSRFPLYLISNIPQQQYESRAENLKYHNLNYTGLYLAGHFNFGSENYPTKSEMIRELHNPKAKLVFLDDHPKNCLDIRTHFPDAHVYLMDRPHNQNVADDDWRRVKDWDEFNDFIVQTFSQ